jgi:hypothetical protein
MIKNYVIPWQDERQGEAVSEDSLPVVNEAVLDLHDQALVKNNHAVYLFLTVLNFQIILNSYFKLENKFSIHKS